MISRIKDFSNSTLFLSVLVFVTTLGIYLLTLAPTYLPPDGAEFALCVQSIGICHPTGFFLYILLGKLFTLVFPYGTIIYKLNFLSAIYAAGTVLFLCLALLKTGVNKKVSFFVVCIFAVSSGMWEFATNAEVFTLGTLLMSIALFMVVTERFYLSFLCFGLLTAHFPNSLVVLPVLLWYWKKFQQKSIPLLLKGSGLFLLIYICNIVLLFLRMQQNPSVNWGHVSTFEEFYNYLTRKEFGGIFLIQTDQAAFSFSNYFLQLWAYVKVLFVQFGFVLPLVALYGIIARKLYKDGKIIFLTLSFILLSGSTIFSLSSLNPNVNVNFQFEKFYLASFTVLTLIVGISIGKIKGAMARKYILPILLLVILLIQVGVNYIPHNYHSNYLSERQVNDALSELPDNAIVITLTNQYFFEAWYEQQFNHKYKNITFLYIPNKFNNDYQKYHPEVFPTTATTQNILANLLMQNPHRPIFIWQGVYENGTFLTNKLYANMLTPFGLWWKVGIGQDTSYNTIKRSEDLLTGITYRGVSTSDLNGVQRIEDLQTYIQSFQSTSFALIKLGKYDEALNLLNLASTMNNNPNLEQEIAAIHGIKSLEPQTKSLIKQKDTNTLIQLAKFHYTVRNFGKCVEVFKDILTFYGPNAQMYNNIAIMYDMQNDKTNALAYYNKALKLDPKLQSAFDEKSKIESGN